MDYTNGIRSCTYGNFIVPTVRMWFRASILHTTPKNSNTIAEFKNVPMADEFFIHPTAIVDDDVAIGEGTRVWHFSHLMAGCKLGCNCNIGQNVFIASGVVLGNNVKVQNNVSLYTGVICDDYVFLGPSCVFTNIVNPRSSVVRRDEYVSTHVGKGATIGANATIICGNNIGEYAFVGAGAVVTKTVLPYALVMGNPARQTGWMSEYGHRLKFNEDGVAVCSEGGEKYILKSNAVTKLK